MSSIANRIENEMQKNKGKVYSIRDFYNLGTKNTIKSIMYRLCENNKIERLIDGLYTIPKYSPILNEYSYPDVGLFNNWWLKFACFFNYQLLKSPFFRFLKFYLNTFTQIN
ncbi:DUF6088 family protein [Mycoplasma sp. Ms02]|uniref:DUF6088 family protein n=1 Tax=Mycoplasma sp. Ms02 TaxID=353851 RepID=UPI001C891266|nr:DUF6088 family protein [Mycoplasma sp. Ms02]QZE12421.1 hypothetical protein K4L35_00300 [Mycoplasma sp. Ms02]